ncbi:MAG TPA: nucleotidyltransferase domain-containing protein, partial [Egibacteraceae bacterium]|nr:nucleotidyltransferase domain-containing protein [Egibacteraceae bacterium]
MFASSPLDRLFGNGPAKVLDALLRSDGLTVRQVSRVAGIAPGTASAALRRLERQWVVVGKPVGSALQYWVNEAHFAVGPLRDLVARAERLEASLPQLIVSILGTTPRSVILFGSVARSEADRDSDVDVLVVAHSEKELDWWRN